MRAALLAIIMMMSAHTHARLTVNCSTKTDQEIKSLILSFSNQFTGVSTIVNNDRSIEIWPLNMAEHKNHELIYKSESLQFKINDFNMSFEQEDFELITYYKSRKIVFSCYSRGKLSL
jgi:hypothetical protein